MLDTSRTYTKQELHEALMEHLYGGPAGAGCEHMYGHGNATHQLSQLQTITATVLLDYQYYMQQTTAPSIESLLAQAQQRTPLDLYTVIRDSQPTMALAAEFKRASPSKGWIASDEASMDAALQARLYSDSGANILSVLTEPRWFHGSLDDLRQVRAAVPATTALLRKDFIVNEYMIAEAAAAGADTILLIVAVLPGPVLQRLIHYARDVCGMEPLVEVHAPAELPVALHAGARVIGVNNRNLHTFQVDLATSERMAERCVELGYTLNVAAASDKSSIALCALSGMSTAWDVERYRQAGISMCLIGESLMRAADPGAAIRGLGLDPRGGGSAAATARGGGAYTAGTQLIKVCGITRADDAAVACRAGANCIGVIFAEKSKRKVTKEQAQEVVDTVRRFGERTQRADMRLPEATAVTGAVQHLAANAQALLRSVQRPVVVGVFQNQDEAFIRTMVEECGLDMVQLHGQEGMQAAAVSNFGVPVLRVVDIAVDPTTKSTATNAVESILESVTTDPTAILLDTSIKGSNDGGGGTGVTFDWTIAERLQNSGLPVIIAGGLNADSITDCVSSIRPFGVDVSSGVEASPGVKDHDQVTRFVRDARAAAAEASKGF